LVRRRGYITYKRLFRLALGAPGRAASHPQTEKIAQAGWVYFLEKISLPKARKPVSAQTFTFQLNKVRLRQVRRREGQYLLRTNFPEPKGGSFWSLYTQLS
jgi:hypothetical protein